MHINCHFGNRKDTFKTYRNYSDIKMWRSKIAKSKIATIYFQAVKLHYIVKLIIQLLKLYEVCKGISITVGFIN